jgi:hypothetical protein
MVRNLVGDTNDDSDTNLIDVAQVKEFDGGNAEATGARYDVNVDYDVNLIDMAAVKELDGNDGPCP